MTRKLLCIILAATMLMLVAVGCRDQAAPAAPAAADDWKIGIITGTVSQNEEEFRAAQNMIAKHGAGRIITATYPDRFNDEVETTIAQVVSLADQGAKAIIIVQGVPGTIAAIEATKAQYPDVLFVVGVPQETPRSVAGIADVVMLVDELSMGTAVIEQAHAQGAETFIHYSFPRHLGIETIAARRALFIEACERLGIDFVDVTAPDPTGDAGLAGAQQFIIEDVPRQIAQFGPNTAFFSTNCGMQEPLIRGVMEQRAIYPQPCCPSPYHAFPAAMNIDVSGREGDIPFLLDQITQAVSAAGNTGRISNWPVPINMLFIEAGVDYAIAYLTGSTNGRHDDAAFRRVMASAIAGYGAEATVSLYADAQGAVENFYLVLSGFVNF